MLNATWTFRGIELVVQNAHGERLRAALTFDATAEPPAFHVTPLDPPGERALWIIWARQGDELRLAFYDGVDRRPEDFGPRRKLVVLTLVPARGAATPCRPRPMRHPARSRCRAPARRAHTGAARVAPRVQPRLELRAGSH